jgi:hypothetical protein
MSEPNNVVSLAEWKAKQLIRAGCRSTRLCVIQLVVGGLN